MDGATRTHGIILHPLAELVTANDPRRLYLENLDKLSQAAIDFTRTYNKGNGKNMKTIEVWAPQWEPAIRAQTEAAAILRLASVRSPAQEKNVGAYFARRAETNGVGNGAEH